VVETLGAWAAECVSFSCVAPQSTQP